MARILAAVAMLLAYPANASGITDASANCDVGAAKQYNDVESDRLLAEMRNLISEARVISQKRSELATLKLELATMSSIERGLKSATNYRYNRSSIDAQDKALASQLNTILLKSNLVELEMKMLSSEVDLFTQKCGAQ